MPPDPSKSHNRDCDDDYQCPPPPGSGGVGGGGGSPGGVGGGSPGGVGGDSPGGRRLVTPLVITASVLVFFFIVSLSIYCLVRRLRRRRRQQQSLLDAEAANPVPGVEGDAASDVEMGAALDVDWETLEGQDGEVEHHAWHIRTVGLDEAAIESIALMRYRAGAGMLAGATDCSVCLGEFLDGELLRLLPACSHAFHVPCIDTWLRAHVNCPLCRAHVVLDPAAAGDSTGANADADTGAEQAPIGIEAMDHELGPDQNQNEQQDLPVQTGERHQSMAPEPQHRQPGARVLGFRRAASMDLMRPVSTEDEPNSKENQGNSGAACGKVPSGSGRLYHMKRSLSGGGGGGRWPLASRHYHTRSSMLPS